MKFKNLWLTALIILCAFSAVFSATKEELARQVVSNDANEANEAIKSLRTLGKDGLETLFQTYGTQINKFANTGESTDEWKRISFALDSVAMQKDVYASRLFWFTDIEEAKREAQKSNKPILSLRLLGNLNEEFSCANSRFFRALLYSNAEISKELRENYILHWKSVRPAPKVTIDFGDGRKIERTLTGNSIHYILSDDGEIIDALPGLYSPKEFLNYVSSAKEINKTLETLSGKAKENTLLDYRRKNFIAIQSKRDKAIATGKIKLTEPQEESNKAIEIAPRAVTKMISEASILRDLDDNFSRYEPQIISDDWKKLAALFTGEVKFDANSLTFIKRQNKNLSDKEMTSLLTNLQNYVSLDTTRNESLFHIQLYQWLNQTRREPLELESFNSRVYTEIFKTPDADKWLGLYTTDVYTALDGNGIR